MVDCVVVVEGVFVVVEVLVKMGLTTSEASLDRAGSF